MNHNRILQGDLEASSGCLLLNRAGPAAGQDRAEGGLGYLEASRVQD